MRRTIYLCGAAACALLAAATASGGGTPGVTSKSVLIGGTTPITGPAKAYSSVAKGAAAYFKYVNAHGGVNGRKIEYRYYDDGYDPAKTTERTRQLVQQDHVFAIFNTLGTATNQAIRPYLNALHVPQLFVASGASTWGKDYKKYPWTIGYQPSYYAEATIYGRYLVRAKPKAKIAVLYQNDDYGQELLKGLQHGLGKKAKQIVAKQRYDVTEADVRSQIAKLKSSHATVLMIFATPQFAIQAYNFSHQLGWRPLSIVNAVSSAANIMQVASLVSGKKQTEGSISIVYLKDPTDGRWNNDPGIKLYRQVMKKYDPRGNAKDVYNVYGMSAAYTMVDALKRAGKNLTRAGIMKAVTHLNEAGDPFVLPGIAIRTTPNDRFPVAQAKLERYHNGRWILFGGVVGVR
jgi:branched-chain amino acid transport system substrate-binding protein